MSGAVTIVMSMLPLRASLSWPIPLAGALSYTLTTVWLGAPGGDLTEWSATSPLHSHIILAVIFWLAWKGRAALEAAERRLFLNYLSARYAAYQQHFRAEKKKQQTVQERVKRFNAERELDQARGTWQPTASGNDCQVQAHDCRIRFHEHMQMRSSQGQGHQGNPFQVTFTLEEGSSTDTQEQTVERVETMHDFTSTIDFGALSEAMNRHLDSAHGFCTSQPEGLASNESCLISTSPNANCQGRIIVPDTTPSIVSSVVSVGLNP
eukprot:gnl/MRDRNA2_/MRDRNA2_15721_c0_seq1.p1 gnl/MRDRNA2_/MRDRNA2_15721_c0~~gnl/MRDRNA2_/MRDRNA2_15721_c0_seq1.p1  ORF type:complete len:279 (+),score=38.95 gnl/MRDRNA2_/MRDRNA2_15721_c0_seq1:45-839(+)